MAPHPRRFRFAMHPQGTPGAAAWRDTARRAEDQGYATLLLPDHHGNQLAPLPALAAAAAATTRLRVGVQVMSNDFRNPVVAAKELATVDLLSDGRLDWGMGAGWLPSDYEATGIALDEPGTRVERLAESITLMRRLFAGETVDHDGVHHRSHGVTGSPRPVQRPHPPLLIGAAHERMLRLAGREADIVSISPTFASRQFGPFPPSVDVETSLDRQLGWIRAGAGDRFDEIELSATLLPARLTDRPAEVAEQIAGNVGLTSDEVLRSPHVVLGSVDQVCDTLVARRERWGLSNYVIPAENAEQFAAVVGRLADT